MADNRTERNTEGQLGRRRLIAGLLGSLAVGWTASALGQGYGAPGYDGSAPMHRKISKAIAHYQYHPNDEMRCGLCVHYRGGIT